jgi:hypothetical protein
MAMAVNNTLEQFVGNFEILEIESIEKSEKNQVFLKTSCGNKAPVEIKVTSVYDSVNFHEEYKNYTLGVKVDDDTIEQFHYLSESVNYKELQDFNVKPLLKNDVLYLKLRVDQKKKKSFDLKTDLRISPSNLSGNLTRDQDLVVVFDIGVWVDKSKKEVGFFLTLKSLNKSK